ncbi:hypothetical protein FHS61_001392 [Altererythrobacter atlanticus]|uniref:Ion channel n=1 Tax=Croceibacterium atlanticum TaxID=1267766 RepID=A0A0F7KWN3_9SPHN|nr:ion channel [Croceibacterium atlanticum]AKH44074.1 Ion channel [Croceibacterium atlanticum]MBB5732383.1 hypothetical protein [Croceibacterium atlanticum]
MIAMLFTQFAISSFLVVVCVTIHGFGLFGLSRVMHTERARERIERINPLSPRGTIFTLGVVIAIVMLHGTEIWLFAFVYLILGAVGNFEQALYFSTISYSTVGYSDAHIQLDWRLIGAFESILGVILMGWSTAFFFRILTRIDPH